MKLREAESLLEETLTYKYKLSVLDNPYLANSVVVSHSNNSPHGTYNARTWTYQKYRNYIFVPIEHLSNWRKTSPSAVDYGSCANEWSFYEKLFCASKPIFYTSLASFVTAIHFSTPAALTMGMIFLLGGAFESVAKKRKAFFAQKDDVQKYINDLAFHRDKLENCFPKNDDDFDYRFIKYFESADDFKNLLTNVLKKPQFTGMIDEEIRQIKKFQKNYKKILKALKRNHTLDVPFWSPSLKERSNEERLQEDMNMNIKSTSNSIFSGLKSLSELVNTDNDSRQY